MRTCRRVVVSVPLLLVACGNADERSGGVAKAESIEPVTASAPFDVQLSQCSHIENTVVGGRPAEYWRAEYYGSEDVRSLKLEVWRLESGESELKFRARQGDQVYHIITVEDSPKVGTAAVTVEPSGEGSGTLLTVTGKDQSGNDLRAVVACNDLIEPVTGTG